MSPKTVLIIGANRGIGLQLLKTFQAQGWTAYGTHRPQTTDSSIDDLKATGATMLQVDYTDPSSIHTTAERLGSETVLDCLVNCAGVPMGTRDTLTVPWTEVMQSFQIMTVGPLIAIQAFMPNLKRSEFAQVVNISSDAASIAQSTGRIQSYRIAKAGLNMMTKTMAEGLRGTVDNVAFYAVHPGFVPTKLSDFDPDAPDEIVPCCDGIVDQLSRKGMEESGTYWDWDGSPRPW